MPSKAVGLEEWAVSQENVEIVRRVYEAFNRLDLTAMLDLLYPDIECGTGQNQSPKSVLGE